MTKIPASKFRAQGWFKCMHLTVETGRLCKLPPWKRVRSDPQRKQMVLTMTPEPRHNIPITHK